MVKIHRDSISQLDAVNSELRIEGASLAVSKEGNKLAGIVRDGIAVQVWGHRTILAVLKFSCDKASGAVVQSNIANRLAKPDIAPHSKQVRFAIEICVGDIKMSKGCAFQTNSKQAGRQKPPMSIFKQDGNCFS